MELDHERGVCRTAQVLGLDTARSDGSRSRSVPADGLLHHKRTRTSQNLRGGSLEKGFAPLLAIFDEVGRVSAGAEKMHDRIVFEQVVKNTLLRGGPKVLEGFILIAGRENEGLHVEKKEANPAFANFRNGLIDTRLGDESFGGLEIFIAA